MAIDYGYWSALSTGYQSSQDRKRERDAQSMREIQMLQMLQTQQAQRIDQQNKIQQELDNAALSATQLLNSSFGRQKDIDDMKKWHSEHSGWQDIKNVIQQYNGDYTQARLYGNLDYYINQYKMNINNPHADPTQGNPILRRVANNKANLTNFIAAQQNAETKDLLMPGDLDRYQAFISGETDEFDFRGIRGDWDITTMMADTDLGQEIDLDTFYAHNMHAILSDMSKDTGIDMGTLQNNPEAVKTWIKDALNWTGEPVYGEKKVDTSYRLRFKSNLDEMPGLFAKYKGSAQPFTVKEVLELDEKYGEGDVSGFARLLEGRGMEGEAYSDIWAMLGGYEQGDTPHSKLGGTNVIAGHQLMASGRILTDPALQTAVLKSMYGDNYFADGQSVNSLSVHGLYTETGTMVTDDDISGTWWQRGVEVGAASAVTGAGIGAVTGPGALVAGGVSGAVGFAGGALGFNPFGEGEEMDLKYNGTYLGFRVHAVDSQTGNMTSFLLTRDSDESDISKIKEQYGNMSVEVVMVNELIDTDYTTSDDMYYDVVDINNLSFIENMEKFTDSESLSKVYNQDLSYEQKQKNEAFYIQRKEALTQDLANIYTEGNTNILPEVAGTYKSSIETGLVVGGVSAETSSLTSPIVMSWLLTEANKESGGDMKKTNEIMQLATSELSGMLGQSQNAELAEALKKGPKAFMNWYSKNTDKETFDKFKKINKSWSQYFTLN